MSQKLDASYAVIGIDLARTRSTSLARILRCHRAAAEMSGAVTCGRLRVGKKNLHFAALVGAAMCSAFLRGAPFPFVKHLSPVFTASGP